MKNIKNVLFNETEHKYTYLGRELKGVTKAIAMLLNKKLPTKSKAKSNGNLFDLATLYGTDVHKEVENYFNCNKSVHTDAGKWVVKTLQHFCNERNIVQNVICELIVSDFEATASKIDAVIFDTDGAYLFDIKTTSKVDRKYCSLQLSVYQRLFELCYGLKVKGLFVLGTKSQRIYKMLPSTDFMINAVLEFNKL